MERKRKAWNASEPKGKEVILDISTEELFLGNDHYFIKWSQVIHAIISRRIEGKISK